ncbi:hypothetical protein C7448_102490 [Tenacibaculum gallaicum]|uniref:Uncharacterized protein n=1 Tax=Tenacibaculum gallaicum TaxID=561505 RepID=A0A3E0I8I5_9FLAO|nr:hypothetical protein [Tenacibaculum gallaicum]REH54957.1 hypothetical protein C7448_102490 [Tenacibaculum gallaicum]
MSNTIKLNFINRSNDANNSDVVIFQKNVASNFDEIATAWKVIKNCGRLDNHPFNYPKNFQINASDSCGNFTPQLTAYNGNGYEMVKSTSGNILQSSSTPATNAEEVEIRNNLTNGSINAHCYRNGKLLASKRNIAPGQKAVFKFNPKLYIGLASEIVEGEILNSAIISKINTEINLFEVQSADIVMTGGGSEPFNFSLENVT